MRLQKVFAPLWRVNKYICRHNQFSTKLLFMYIRPNVHTTIQRPAIASKSLPFELGNAYPMI